MGLQAGVAGFIDPLVGLMHSAWMGVRTVVIGRESDVDIRIQDPSVSRHHAELTISALGKTYLTDRLSSQGTFVAEGGEWRQIQQEFVDLDTTVLLGRYQTTMRELYARVPPEKPVNQPTQAAQPSAAAKPKEDIVSRIVGRVRRNPETGEIERG